MTDCPFSLPGAAYKEKQACHNVGIQAFLASDERITARHGYFPSLTFLLSPFSQWLQVSGIIIQWNVFISWDTPEKNTTAHIETQRAEALGTALSLVSGERFSDTFQCCQAVVQRA